MPPSTTTTEEEEGGAVIKNPSTTIETTMTTKKNTMIDSTETSSSSSSLLSNQEDVASSKTPTRPSSHSNHSKRIDTSAAKLVMPYGRCILPNLIERDTEERGQSGIVLWTIIGTMIVLLLFVPLLPVTLTHLANHSRANGGRGSFSKLYTGWDDDHGITEVWNHDSTNHVTNNWLLRVIFQLFREGMGLEPSEVSYMFFGGTVLPFFILAILDYLRSMIRPSSSKSKSLSSFITTTIDWPRSWNVGNTECYNDMFCEPTTCQTCTDGMPRLVRRPGNTYSNLFYLFGSHCILYSSYKAATSTSLSSTSSSSSYSNVHNPFWEPDAFFGVMLLILSIMSIVWHASNAPWSHYVDLWSMECCILYLTVRITSLGCSKTTVLRHGILTWLYHDVNPDKVASLLCFLVFGLLVLVVGIVHYQHYRTRFFHGGFPLSGRYRHYNRGIKQTFVPDLNTYVVILYAALPLAYLTPATFASLYMIQSSGSLLAATLAAATLVIGWEVRLFERYALDGWYPMNFIRHVKSSRRLRTVQASSTMKNMDDVSSMVSTWIGHDMPHFVLTVLAAISSPTANLHFFTGITLLAGYIHVRTLDD